MRTLILAAITLALALDVPAQNRADEEAMDAFEKVMTLMKASPDGQTLDEAAAKAQAQRFQAELGAFVATWQPRAKELTEARLLVGRALMLTGKPAEAIPHFKYFVAQHKDSPDIQEATISLGTAYLDSRDWASAGAVLSSFLAAYPKSDRRVVAEYYLAIARHQQGALDEALSRLASVAASGDESPLVADASMKSIEFLRDAGRVDEARKLLATVKTQHGESRYVQALDEQLSWIGKPAPALVNVSDWLKGPATKVAGPKDQVIVLNFFADKYESCQIELEALQDMARTFQGRPVTFVGLTKYYRALDRVPAADQRKQLDAFLSKHGVQFPVGIARDFTNLRAYSVRGIPHTVVIGKDGTVQHMKIGSSQRNQRALADLRAAIERAL